MNVFTSNARTEALEMVMQIYNLFQQKQYHFIFDLMLLFI